MKRKQKFLMRRKTMKIHRRNRLEQSIQIGFWPDRKTTTMTSRISRESFSKIGSQFTNWPTSSSCVHWPTTKLSTHLTQTKRSCYWHSLTTYSTSWARKNDFTVSLIHFAMRFRSSSKTRMIWCAWEPFCRRWPISATTSMIIGWLWWIR